MTSRIATSGRPGPGISTANHANHAKGDLDVPVVYFALLPIIGFAVHLRGLRSLLFNNLCPSVPICLSSDLSGEVGRRRKTEDGSFRVGGWLNFVKIGAIRALRRPAQVPDNQARSRPVVPGRVTSEIRSNQIKPNQAESTRLNVEYHMQKEVTQPRNSVK